MGRAKKPEAGPYDCAFCGRRIATSKASDLLRHFKTGHCYDRSGSRTTTCPICVRERAANAVTVYTKGDLAQHLLRLHKNRTPRRNVQAEVVPLDEDGAAHWSAQDEGLEDDYDGAEGAEGADEAMEQEALLAEHSGQTTVQFDELELALHTAAEIAHTPLPPEVNLPSVSDSSEDEGGEDQEELPMEVVSAQPDSSADLVCADYRLHAESLGEAIHLFRTCLLVIEKHVTETTLQGFVEMAATTSQRPLFPPTQGIARIPTSVKRIQSKSRRLLGPVLKPEVFMAERLESSQPVAFLNPADVVVSWLSLPEVLDALVRRSAESLHHFVAGTNPIQSAYASGSCPTIAETWHGTEYYDSVARARPFWEPRYQAGQNCLFVHLGFFFDSFQAIERISTGVIIMSLMGVSKALADKLDLHLPLCLFREDNDVDPLEAALARLRPQMEQLARGLDFTAKGGRQYRVFCVTSHLYGDIPAVREVAGLKGGNCFYPCPYCLLQGHYGHANEECVYRCASRAGSVLPPNALVGVTFPPKTETMYQEAFADPFCDDSTRRMALWASPSNANDPLPRRTGAAKHFRLFPGVSFPNSLCTDLMHNEFLGESKAHLGLLLGRVAAAMGISGEELACRLSAKFGVLQTLNRSYVRFEFWNLKGVNYMSAAAVKKLVIWSMHLFRLAEVPLDDVSLAPHLQAWELRVATVSRLSRRVFTPAELRDLTHSLRELSQMCCTLYTRFCSIKTHLMKNHAVEIIKRLGPMTHYWSFRAESKIGHIKGLYQNSNGHAVTQSIFSRVALSTALQRVLGYLDVTPFASHRPKVSPGEYGIPVANVFVLRRGATLDHVLRIRKVVVTLAEEVAQVARAPLFTFREQAILIVRGQDLVGAEEVPLADLLPVDVVPYGRDYLQLVGHEVYGLTPAPTRFLVWQARYQQ